MATPIQWQQSPDWNDADICDDFGLYSILDGVLFIGHDGDGTPYDSEEAAKAAAQADWDARVARLKGGAA
ncbi:hypothetical protein [Paracoccus fontiphilus]|uniref:Uncharacterized protein n=1 Tax=Paracoccus fontiphilus TaxID=1815556 RepID=A0ABV7IF91_9RHOB|nr:hypothetical protein [Paracoccus fontiphilus]